MKVSLVSSSRKILHVEDSQSAVKLGYVKFAPAITLAIRAVSFP
jgi:hypothetical protein